MKKYYSCYNNGVTAVVSEEVMKSIQKRNRIVEKFQKSDADVPYEKRFRENAAYEELKHLATPIFTFANSERVTEQPWFTGSFELLASLKRHIEAEGGFIEQSGFFVPFSNGCELGIIGEDAMRSELMHVTTETQFQETFGISIAELNKKMENEKFSSSTERPSASEMVQAWRRRAEADAAAEGEA